MLIVGMIGERRLTAYCTVLFLRFEVEDSGLL